MIKKKITKKRGDTFWFTFKPKNDKVIEAGSTVKCGIMLSDNSIDKELVEELKVTQDLKEITFAFSPMQTKRLIPSEELELEGLSYILEVEITTKEGYVDTPFQETIEIVRDYIHE